MPRLEAAPDPFFTQVPAVWCPGCALRVCESRSGRLGPLETCARERGGRVRAWVLCAPVGILRTTHVRRAPC